MAIELAQTWPDPISATGGTSATASGDATTAGSLLTCRVTTRTAGSGVTITDSASNAWVEVGHASHGAGDQWLFYCEGADSVTSVTAHTTLAGNKLIFVSEWSGVAESDAMIDHAVQAWPSDTDFDPVVVDPAVDGCLIFGTAGSAVTNRSYSQRTSGYTDQTTIRTGQMTSLAAYQIQTTAAESGPEWDVTSGSAAGLGQISAAFKSASLGPATITPNGRTSARTVGQPTITASGSVTITPNGRASALTVGQPTVVPAPTTIRPSGRASQLVLGQLVITATGAVVITPDGRATAWQAGTPTLRSGGTTATPATRPSARQVGQPTLTATGHATITPSGRASGLTVGQPTVIPAPATITPHSRASGRTVGTVTLLPTGHALASPTTRASTLLAGTPILTASGHATIAPSGRASALTVGQPTVTIVGEHVTTPAARTLVIRAESRTLTIPAESRTLVIGAP